MNKVFLIGIEYDDFGDGGFSVIAVTETKEQALEMIEKAKEKNPSPTYSIRKYKLNKFHESFY